MRYLKQKNRFNSSDFGQYFKFCSNNVEVEGRLDSISNDVALLSNCTYFNEETQRPDRFFEDTVAVDIKELY